MRTIQTQVFERIVEREYRFLVEDYGFGAPEIVSKEEEYRDRIIFATSKAAAEVLNAYHGVDYGFEVNYYPDKRRIGNAGDDLSASEMVYYKLKEKQDTEGEFIREGAIALRKFLEDLSDR